jgi:hypothetical protein
VAAGDQINFKPSFEQQTVPCEGDVGDLFVMTRLKEGEPDNEPQGVASLWFCIKEGRSAERPAIWARVQFDGIATCAAPVPQPPQNRPTLTRG